MKIISFIFSVIFTASSIFANNLPPNDILGYGTQLIDSQNSFLINRAIKIGYRLFDTAMLYKNIDLISAQIKESKTRENLYIVYKIIPPTNSDELSEQIKDINQRIEEFGFIDCLMFHDIPDNLNTEIMQNLINQIKELIKTKKIEEFGVSNIGPDYEEIITSFKEKGLNISLIENKLNNNIINFSPTKDLLSYCKENSIAFIAYGALGGSTQLGPCRVLCEPNLPVIYFDNITHPHLAKISKEYELDPMMVMLAFQAKKYGVYHIPSTTNEERLESNFISYAKAYKILSEIDLVAINNEIGIASAEEFSSISKTLREATKFRSRLRLIEYLINSNNPLIEIINEMISLGLFNDEDKIRDFVNKMLYIYEQARKFGSEEQLNNLLSDFNNLIKPISKERFIPVFENIFNLKKQDAPGHPLYEQFIIDLKAQIKVIEFALARYFTIEDISEKNSYLIPITVADLDTNKIIKFTMQSPLTVEALAEKLRQLGLGTSIYGPGTGWNLINLENNEQAALPNVKEMLRLQTIQILTSSKDLGESTVRSARIFLRYDPFKNPQLFMK